MLLCVAGVICNCSLVVGWLLCGWLLVGCGFLSSWCRLCNSCCFVLCVIVV